MEQYMEIMSFFTLCNQYLIQSYKYKQNSCLLQVINLFWPKAWYFPLPAQEVKLNKSYKIAT